MKKYLFHWFGYCYYRNVKFYTKEGEEPEFERGLIPFYYVFAALYCAALLISHPVINYKKKLPLCLLLFPIAVVLNKFLSRYFNSSTYNRMQDLFCGESKKCQIVAGILVVITQIGPIMALILYALVCRLLL